MRNSRARSAVSRGVAGHPNLLTLSVLGDSIAFGTGADRPDDALGPRLLRALADAGIAARLQVQAVPGAVSADLAGQVARAGSPDLVLVVVGANDLTRMVAPHVAAGQLAAAVRALRERGADVLVAPAPDLSAVPWVPAQLRAAARTLSDQLHRQQADAVRAAGGVVVPIAAVMSERFAAQPRLFPADRFHPSSGGYALIAAELAPLLVSVARSRTAPVTPRRPAASW